MAFDGAFTFRAERRASIFSTAVEKVRKGALSAGAALMLLLSPAPDAHAQSIDASDKASLVELIRAFDEDIGKSIVQGDADSLEVLESERDSISELLVRHDEVGALELLHSHRPRVDLTKKFNDPANKDAFKCLVHNVLREAGSDAEIGAGGGLAVATVTLLRAFDPQKRFFDKKDSEDTGNVCAAVFAKKQFSWTFDTRILTQVVSEKRYDQYKRIEKMLGRLVGEMTPEEALTYLLSLHNSESTRSLYYHHKYMWYEEVGEDDAVVFSYGEKPPRRATETEEAYTARAGALKMSRASAHFFNSLKKGDSIGSHIFFSDPPEKHKKKRSKQKKQPQNLPEPTSIDDLLARSSQ